MHGAQNQSHHCAVDADFAAAQILHRAGETVEEPT